MNQPVYFPGTDPGTVRDQNGKTLPVPPGWVLLPPGDAALTRRVKAKGEFWLVQEKRGRKTFSRGLWAPQITIEQIQADLAAERQTDSYARKQASAARRREKVQTEYVSDFTTAVKDYLNFSPCYAELAEKLSLAVTIHATPVGSGTVARTQQIPLADRARAAVLAWMRHQTTAYDSMQVPRTKGARRELRKQLSQDSKALLKKYRQGEATPADCPLKQALAG